VAHVLAFLRDYLIYAMRFADPQASGEFRAMQSYLFARETIPLGAFDAYIGSRSRFRTAGRPTDRR
jgi:hypothetical protein